MLSPILFNLFLIGLEDIGGSKIKIIQYADDVVLYTTGECKSEIYDSMCDGLDRVGCWLENIGLSISPEKTKAILFSRKRSNSVIPDIPYRGNVVHMVPNVKYLGMYLDCKLNWKLHISQTLMSCIKAINLMKCLCSKKWGSDPSILLALYRGLIRSRLDYGCFLYASASTSNFCRIERIQFQAIRIALGALRSTPTNALQVEAGEEPLQIRFVYLGQKFLLKRSILNKDPVCEALEKLWDSYKKSKTYRNRPVILSCFESISEYASPLTSNIIGSCFMRSFGNSSGHLLLFKSHLIF